MIEAPRRRSTARRAARWLCLVMALAVFVGFLALGTWQIQRRTWKLALIERVTQRVGGPPAALPLRGSWTVDDATENEYRRVRATGIFLNDRETLVQATTDYGGGFWVMTPLETADGRTVLVNRGFVSPARRDRRSRDDGSDATRMPADVVGLLRSTQPGGSFLRRNDSANERWYSRDVRAIASARGLVDAAPYFIDAQETDRSGNVVERGVRGEIVAGTEPARWPVAGLTVIDFHNNHLVYAVTWFALAAMVAAATAYVLREDRKRRRPGDDDSDD